MPPDTRKRAPVTSGGAQETAGQHVEPIVTPTPDRRPCRICRKRSRPLVPVGSSRWWDLCHRCARGASRPYLDAPNVVSPNPWTERVAEVLAEHEGQWAP